MKLSPYYKDAAVTLYHGDCLDVLPQLEPVDHVITDPPYDEQTHSRGGSVVRYDGGPDIAAIPFAALSDIGLIAGEVGRLVRRWVLVFCAVRQIEQWSVSFESVGLRVPRIMVWVKPDASPQFSGDRPGHGYESIVLAHPAKKTRWNGGGHKGVFTHCRIDRSSEWLHPTQKPVPLLTELVSLFTDEDETILDPFAGSGTTLVAAKLNGRKAIGIEKSEQYCAVAAKRLRETEPGRLFDALPRAKQITLLEKP